MKNVGKSQPVLVMIHPSISTRRGISVSSDHEHNHVMADSSRRCSPALRRGRSHARRPGTHAPPAPPCRAQRSALTHTTHRQSRPAQLTKSPRPAGSTPSTEQPRARAPTRGDGRGDHARNLGRQNRRQPPAPDTTTTGNQQNKSLPQIARCVDSFAHGRVDGPATHRGDAPAKQCRDLPRRATHNSS
jgi:hypothetical protein